jgi:hypothetical protein
MEWLVWTTTVLLVVGVGGVAMMKVTSNEEVVKQAKRLGYEPVRKATGYAELAGLVGVVIGAANSDLQWLGISAATGIAGMMLGAIVYHRRAGDIWPTTPSIVMLISAAVYIVELTRT